MSYIYWSLVLILTCCRLAIVCLWIACFQGKVFDKSEVLGSLRPTPRMRPKAASRPRPKTIHIDSGSVEMAEGLMQPSRGKKGSTSNLTGIFSFFF